MRFPIYCAKEDEKSATHNTFERNRVRGGSKSCLVSQTRQELTTADELGYGGGENPTMASKHALSRFGATTSKLGRARNGVSITFALILLTYLTTPDRGSP